MPLADELQQIAAVASAHARPGEQVAAVLAAEPDHGARVYLCAFAGGGERGWLALDERGRPVDEHAAVRDAVSIAALCEIAADSAGGGDLEQLRADLAALRMREHPPGIEEAEDAALALERAIGSPPRVATPAYLDRVGAATRRLERALGDDGGSPFAEAMTRASAAVEALVAEVERSYRGALADGKLSH